MKFSQAQAEKNIRLTRGWVDDSRAALENWIKRGDPILIYRNFASLVSQNLALGLYLWKKGDDPTPQLKDAVDAGVRALDIANETEGWEVHLHQIPIPTLRTVGFLLGIEDKLRNVGHQEETAEVRLQELLGDVLYDHKSAPEALESARSEPKGTRTQLLVDSFEAYFSILSASPNDAGPLIREAEANFLRRARNSYYSGGVAYMGGGPDNPYTVDVLLAAVMKKMGYSGDSAHRFIW